MKKVQKCQVSRILRGFNESLNLISIKKYSRSYLYPLDVRCIYENLEGNGHASRVEDYIDYKNIRSVKQIVSNVRDIIRNQPLNPHAEYEPLKYYVKSDNLICQLDNIYDDLADNLNSRILYIGNKGSGKTLAQNCWLHENNAKLEKNNIFWVRCDAAKLYRIWVDPKYQKIQMSELVSIDEYFSGQLLYVFLKYLNTSELFKRIAQEIKDSGITYMYRRSKRSFLHKEESVYDGIMESMNDIKVEMGKKKGWSYAVYMMEESQKVDNIYKYSWEKWLNLSGAIERFLLDRGYKILKILDGVDNVELGPKNSFEYFKRMIGEVSKMVVYKPSLGVLCFIAIRPETYGYMRSINNIISTESYEFGSHPKKIIHVPPDISDVSKKRYDYLCSFIRSEKLSLVGKDKDSSLFMAVLERVFINPIYANKSMLCYNENIRLYLHGQLSLALQVYYRLLQVGSGCGYDIYDAIYRLFYKRNKILDGRLFLNSKTEEVSNIYQGKSMFNPFYFNVQAYYMGCDYKKYHWPGLCCLRIIQTINYTQNNSADSIRIFLGKEFRYKEDYVDNCLRLLEGFGVILVDSDNLLSNLKYRITEKGRLFYKFIYSDFDVLYYLALDTPLPQDFFDKDCVCSHLNKTYDASPYIVPTPSKYISSSLITVYYFISFIRLVDYYEREELMLTEEYKDKFKLPIYSKYSYYPLIKRVVGLYLSASNEEKIKIKEKVFRGADSKLHS